MTFVRVERHMSTTVSLSGTGIDDALADRFFARVRELEATLSRYRRSSDVSRLGCRLLRESFTSITTCAPTGGQASSQVMRAPSWLSSVMKPQ